MVTYNAFGSPVEDTNNMVGVSEPVIVAAATSHVDASKVDEKSEKPHEAVARLTGEAQVIRDKIKALGGNTDGMPEISGMTPTDLQTVVDVYERKRVEVADKAAAEFQKNAMGAALGAAGLAGAGVASPEISEAIREKNSLPINKELEKMLEKGGANRVPLTRVFDPQDVNEKELSFLQPNAPAMAANIDQKKSTGFERSA